MVSLHYEVGENMTTDGIALGVDISKKKFDVALFRNGKPKHKGFKNDAQGFGALIEWLSKQHVMQIHVCMEATGISGKPLAECLLWCDETQPLCH
jgi:transposase